MFLERVNHFGETLGDQVNGRSPKKLKSLMFLDRVIHFGETLGDKVRVRSLKKQKKLIEVTSVVHVKVHVLSFNMILISSP